MASYKYNFKNPEWNYNLRRLELYAQFADPSLIPGYVSLEEKHTKIFNEFKRVKDRTTTGLFDKLRKRKELRRLERELSSVNDEIGCFDVTGGKWDGEERKRIFDSYGIKVVGVGMDPYEIEVLAESKSKADKTVYLMLDELKKACGSPEAEFKIRENMIHRLN